MNLPISAWLCLVGFLALPALFDVLVRFRRSRIWPERDPVPANRIYQSFYRKRGLDRRVVEPAWRELTFALDVRPGSLRPFDEIRGLQRFYGPFDSLPHRIQLVLRGYLAPGSACPDHFATIDDIIVFISDKWQQRLNEAGASPTLEAA